MLDSCGPFLFTFDCSGPQRLLTPCTEALRNSSTLLGCTKICSVQHRGFWCLHKGLYILLNYSEMHRVLLMSTQRPWWSPRCPHLHRGPFKSIQRPLLTDQLNWSLLRSTQKLMDLRGLLIDESLKSSLWTWADLSAPDQSIKASLWPWVVLSSYEGHRESQACVWTWEDLRGCEGLQRLLFGSEWTWKDPSNLWKSLCGPKRTSV